MCVARVDGFPYFSLFALFVESGLVDRLKADDVSLKDLALIVLLLILWKLKSNTLGLVSDMIILRNKFPNSYKSFEFLLAEL